MTPISYTNRETPFFLSGSAGKLFTLYFPPANGGIVKKAVLYFPPFAEEANKARRMAVLQARKLAGLGYGVLLVDCFGTGDSEGDFGEARWNIWRDDLTRAAGWLVEQGAESLIFWGLRLGATLALELAATINKVQVQRLLLWQPVVRGDMFMTQFLRLRMAADMIGKQEKRTTSQLREDLGNGCPLEIAGYMLAPEMFNAVNALDMQKTASEMLPPVDWIEIAATNDQPLSTMAARTVDQWRNSGVRIASHVIKGESFWSTLEIAIAPALLERTSELLTVRAA